MKRKAVGLLLAVLICVGMFAGCGGGEYYDELPYVCELDGYEIIVEDYVIVNSHVGYGYVSYMYGFYDFPDNKTISEMNWILKDDANLHMSYYSDPNGKNEIDYFADPDLLLENKVVLKGISGSDMYENRYPFEEGKEITISSSGGICITKVTADKMIEVNRGNNIVYIGDGISQEQLDYIKADLYL